MEKKMKWFGLRWRIVVLVLLLILFSTGYVGWRFYNAVRPRPMGEGPAGPTVTMEPFQQAWSDAPHVLIGIGDSVTRGLGAAMRLTYFELLLRNDDVVHPDMQGRDLSTVLANLSERNYAQDYTTSQDHLDRQLVKIPVHDPNVRGIVVITSGGNDLIHDYGRTPPQDGAMYGCTYQQAAVWCENLKGRLDALLKGVMEKFPGGCEIFLANIYDPTDGVSDSSTVGLPRWPAGSKTVRLANQKIAELCEAYLNVHLVDIHSEFLGHGIHCDEPWRKHYRREDPHYWYYTNLEDPNQRGFDAIRRLFLIRMVEVFSRPVVGSANQ